MAQQTRPDPNFQSLFDLKLSMYSETSTTDTIPQTQFSDTEDDVLWSTVKGLSANEKTSLVIK